MGVFVLRITRVVWSVVVSLLWDIDDLGITLHVDILGLRRAMDVLDLRRSMDVFDHRLWLFMMVIIHMSVTMLYLWLVVRRVVVMVMLGHVTVNVRLINLHLRRLLIHSDSAAASKCVVDIVCSIVLVRNSVAGDRFAHNRVPSRQIL